MSVIRGAVATFILPLSHKFSRVAKRVKVVLKVGGIAPVGAILRDKVAQKGAIVGETTQKRSKRLTTTTDRLLK